MNSGMMVAGPSNDECETPKWLFEALHTEFGLGFDAAASRGNALCENFTDNIERDIKIIRKSRVNVWCNPPYSKIEMFVVLALQSPNLWCFLLPSRMGSAWYQTLHFYAKLGRVELRPFRRRIPFLFGGQPIVGKDGKPQGPRFDSLVAIVRPRT